LHNFRTRHFTHLYQPAPYPHHTRRIPAPYPQVTLYKSKKRINENKREENGRKRNKMEINGTKQIQCAIQNYNETFVIR
jgi:hypothetical protein